MAPTEIVTRLGSIPLPAYIPVTTFGSKYPLDNLIRPYLPRLAKSIMVAYHYAKQIQSRTVSKLNLPLMVDSGGFACLLPGTEIQEEFGLGKIVMPNAEGSAPEEVTPLGVLELQESVAEIAFTLDFPCPPNLDRVEAERRQALTIANAKWAIRNRRRRDMPLFACVQAWDAESAQVCIRAYRELPFEGIAIGGLVPRARDIQSVIAIVDAVVAEADGRPVHAFGMGKPGLVRRLFEHGVTSVDSSAYVKLAAEGRWWGDERLRIHDPAPLERLHLALCNLALASQATLPLQAFPFITEGLRERLKPVSHPPR